MNPLDEKANTLSRCGSFYYRTIVDESKAEAEFVSHLPSLTRLVPLGNKISTAIQGGCYYQDYYKLIKFTDAAIDWNGVKEALQKRVRGGMGAITDKLEQVSVSKARELGTQAWELIEEDLPTGLKRIIELKMQVLNTAPTAEPVYLQVFHTTYNGETPINTLIATSTTAISVAAGQIFSWKFDDLLLGTALLANNSKISFQFTKNAASTWQDSDAVLHNIVVGVGSYVPSVQFWRLAGPEQSMPTFNRPAQLTIEDHFFAGDDKWDWISREGTPQPIAFPGGELAIVLPENQELIWDLHIDKDIMVTSIRKDDGTILYANQDFASQFGKLTFLQNPIALFPKMQFMAQSYTGRMPNLYNYLARVDNVYGSIARVMRYMRGSQSIKSLYYASAQAAGLTIVEQDCTIVAVSPLLDGKAYITTAGRYDAAYPHTPLKVGTKLSKDYIIGGNQLYKLIGPYDPVPSNIAGINLDNALPVPGLFAPNKEIAITDAEGNYRPGYIGDASALQAYYTYIDAQQRQRQLQEPNRRENGMQHFRYTACPNRCVVVCINESYMTAQMKLRLMTYLQRELPIGSVLVTANLPNLVNEFQSSISGVDFVLEELRAGLDQLVGAGNYEVEFDNARNTLTIYIAKENIDKIQDLLQRVVPASVNIEYDTFVLFYEPIEKLEMTKGYFIDTGIVGSLKDTVELDVDITDANNNYDLLGWVTWTVVGSEIYFRVSGTNQVIQLHGPRHYDIVTPLSNGYGVGRHVYKWNQKQSSYLYVDDVQLRGGNMGGVWSGNPDSLTWYLAGSNMKSGSTYSLLRPPGKLDCYYFKLWNQDDTLAADLIPVKRKSDGYVGMWCLVREIFIPIQYATKTAELTDEDYEQLAKLESNMAL